MIRIKLFIGLCFIASTCLGQLRDAGLWADFSLSADVGKKWQLAIGPEVRLNENITNINRAFVDFAAQYKFNKHFFSTATYRAGVGDAGTYYSPRQRWQLGFGFRTKWNDFTFTYQPRWQIAVTSLTGESDADFVQTIRNRFQLKYALKKRLDVYSSFETFNDSSPYGSFELQNWRWIAGLALDLNKRNSVSLGYMLQRGFTSTQLRMDYIFLASYQIQLEWGKKSKNSEKENSIPEGSGNAE
jgi:Protein of unknown function (DUF2490)